MVVDDDDDLRLALAELISALGYRVCQARNGREALLKLTEVTPSLVLLDLTMPEMSGWEFLDTVESRKQKLNIIVVTASHEDDAPKGYPVLQKPMTLTQLKDAIERTFRQGSRQD